MFGIGFCNLHNWYIFQESAAAWFIKDLTIKSEDSSSFQENMADYESFLTGCFPSIDPEIVSYVGGRFSRIVNSVGKFSF